MKPTSTTWVRSLVASALALALAADASAGVLVVVSNGIQMTGADGVTFAGTNGIQMTGADGFLAFRPNGIQMTGADGTTPVAPTGIQMTGADAATYVGTDGLTAFHADGIQMTGADGIQMTGADGIVMTGADGTRYRADSVQVVLPSGIVMTGADGIQMTGVDGIVMTGADSLTAARADGIQMTGADGIQMTGADGITAVAPDGTVFTVNPAGIQMTGADSITVSYANGIQMTGADGIQMTGADGGGQSAGLQSMDPELAATLNTLTDDSWVNAVVVYHHAVTSADVADLRAAGVLGGTRFRALPAVVLTATRAQLVAISHLPSVRSIYGNRTLQTMADASRATTGVERAAADADLRARNGGLPYTGRGVTVAVLDTGVDATHPDLAGRVVRNVRLADTQGAPTGFTFPSPVEGVLNGDPAAGHGTFVAGVIAGSGAASGGRYAGVAPEASVVGLAAGDLTLLNVLSGFDYLLDRGPSLGVRVLNCSFSAQTVYDANDPVNVATRMLADAGVTVVFSAGNTGPGWNTLNPYACAPWVVAVGATDAASRLAPFSSRGGFGEAARPALVAPGVSVVGLRGTTAPNVTGVLLPEPGAGLSPLELLSYTVASGTSFSAPQVAGAVALMLQANPSLSPAEVRDILQRSATPLPAYYAHEVGAGMLNAHAAVLEAAFPQRHAGAFRSTLDRGQVDFVRDAYVSFGGTATPGDASELPVQIPADTVRASVRIAWGGLLSPNDLSLSLYDPSLALRGQSNALNLPGLTGRAERVVLDGPRAGAWRARVANTLGIGTAQPYTGTLDVARVVYAPVTDLGGLAPAARDEVYRAIRTFTMQPLGHKFRPGSAVGRADLASALVLAGRAPQYLPGSATYRDVRDQSRMLWVESAQAAPGGPFFYDVVAGGLFGPEQSATRLVAAVAIVRAAGYGAEAQARAGAVLPVSDAATIPASLRGYVAVALERGLMTADGGQFRPQAALTRAELAHALAGLY